MISPRRAHARILLIAAAALFSTGGTAIKATALTGWQVAGFRSGIAALALFLMVPAARRAWGWRPVLVGAAYAATMILFVQATKLTTAANTIFLQSTAPIYLALLGPWLLREPTSRRDLLFLAAIGGALALFFVGNERAAATAPRPVEGNVLALLCGMTWALTIIGLRWMSRSDNGPSPALAVVTGNVLALLLCLRWALPVGAPHASDWLVIMYLGVFQVGLAYACLTVALQHVAALEASLILLLEPVLNPVWVWLIQGERPGGWALLGGAIILLATGVKALLDASRDRDFAASGRPSRST